VVAAFERRHDRLVLGDRALQPLARQEVLALVADERRADEVDDLQQMGVVASGRQQPVELIVGPDRYYAVTARTFADTRSGDLLLYEDSYRNISLAINRGSAAAILKARAGMELVIVPEGF